MKLKSIALFTITLFILARNSALAVNNTVSVKGDNLQICTSGTCSLTPPDTYGNLIIENKLGIGVGTPSFPLDIANSTGQVGLSFTSNTAGSRFRLTNSGAGGRIYDIVSTSGLSGWGQGKFVISDRATDQSVDNPRLTIDNLGNVGIGTPNPVTKLSVLNTAGYGNLEFSNNADGTYIQAYDRGTSAYKRLSIYAGNSGANFGRLEFDGNATVAWMSPVHANGSRSGYVYGDPSFGLLNNAGNWIRYTPAGTTYTIWARELYPGNLNTAVQSSYYLAGNYGGYGLYSNTSLYAAGSLYGPEIYTTNYFRPTGTGGMYWNAYGTRIWSDSAAYIKVATDYGMALYNSALSTLKGYIYTDGSNFGLLNNLGQWAVRIPHNTQEIIVQDYLKTYGAGGLVSYNPSNYNQYVQMNYTNNAPSITIGGTNLFQVRGPGESLWFSTYDTGDILIPGSSSNGGTFTSEYVSCCSGAFRRDNWLRLKRGDGWTYRALAVQQFYANGAIRFDLAEVTPVNPEEDLILGNLIAVDNGDTLRVTKTKEKYDDRLVGIVSHGRTASMTIGGDTGPEKVNTTKDRKPIALAGRVVTIVNLESGAIKAGDPITSSSTPGVGMKATQAGTIVGRAMEGFDGRSTNSKEVTKMVEKLREELKKEDPKTTQYADIADAIRQLTQPLPKNTGRIISFIAVSEENTDTLKDQLVSLKKELDELTAKIKQ